MARLDDLLALRRKLDAEIAIEQRKHRYLYLVEKNLPPPAPTRRPTSREVKEWGVQVGLIPKVVRARCPRWLYEKYLDAHGL